MDMPRRFCRLVFSLLGIIAFLSLAGRAPAADERSIKELTDAIVALGHDVDPEEAELLSVTVHSMTRSLAHEYGVALNPAFQNFLVNTGARKRGYCAHYVRDIGTRLRQMNFKTVVLHWGA